MFHTNFHKQPFTLATLVSTAWQIVNNSAMSLLHTIQQDGTNAPIIMEKVVPSHPVQIRKQKNEVVDLQESAPNAASSPPRSMSEVAAQAAELQVAKPTELKKKNVNNRRNKKTAAEAAPNAELVSAVDGQTTVEVPPVKTEIKEKKTRERKPKKQPLGDVIVDVPQGDEPIPLSPSNDQEKSSLNNADEEVAKTEGVDAEDTETKQTKGNRRRQRQRMNKKTWKEVTTSPRCTTTRTRTTR